MDFTREAAGPSFRNASTIWWEGDASGVSVQSAVAVREYMPWSFFYTWYSKWSVYILTAVITGGTHSASKRRRLSLKHKVDALQTQDGGCAAGAVGWLTSWGLPALSIQREYKNAKGDRKVLISIVLYINATFLNRRIPIRQINSKLPCMISCFIYIYHLI